MQRLTVLYDQGCHFCVRCRWWLARQPSFLEMEFMPHESPRVKDRYPNLEVHKGEAELIVIADDDYVYRDDDAWIMCLYALREYREWSLRFSDPALRPLAGAFFRQVSKKRHAISKWLGPPTSRKLEHVAHRETRDGETCETCRH